MDESLTQCELKRREFLRLLAGATGVVLVGTAGCSKDDKADAPQGKATASVPIATREANGKLRLAGGGKLQPGTALAFMLPQNKPGILFKTSAGMLGALSAVCTHAGCTVAWEPMAGQELLHCPCHNSNFATDGSVLRGPAKKPLQRFQVQASGDDALITPAWLQPKEIQRAAKQGNILTQ